ncbi:MAG: hypothetical protein GEV28_15115 [Actinophytocola sp.]|uniref:hypothetical protein n=1 Tax=Actinophytocola sp. TaxID=1872138 RepID=UPI00132C51B1|nr:hypothetical protein [Actinophytocola sp.]MPZ81651.1 hypothetical protein [Actinophytocola sp.]
MTDPMTDLMTDVRPNGSKTMLIYENLARERMREAEQAAEHARLVRRLSSARRWERLSAWAARRAKRANDLL